jgi:endonuclease/exonuclease/phosphatase family metal-dependent hydrolase
MSRVRIVGMAALLCSGCFEGEDEVLRPDSVMTYNVYLGADIVEPLMATSMTELADRVEAAFAQFQANDFNVRAQSIADRIAEEQPALVGLQEMLTVYLQPTGDRFTGGSEPASQLVIDFEEVLLAALADRGLDYRVAVRGETADVEVPSSNGQDIRVVDHNVILVRGGIAVGETEVNTFEARVPIPTPDGRVIELTRGFVAAEVTLRGQQTLFVNTHLEVSAFEAVQVAQASELLAWVSPQSEPVILVGDFNSQAEPADSTETYDLIANAGFTDAWTLRDDPAVAGFTCCQANDLRNATSELATRIDLIWLLGELPPVTPDVHVIGADAADKTTTGIWPSDHAGVVATFAE